MNLEEMQTKNCLIGHCVVGYFLLCVVIRDDLLLGQE